MKIKDLKKEIDRLTIKSSESIQSKCKFNLFLSIRLTLVINALAPHKDSKGTVNNTLKRAISNMKTENGNKQSDSRRHNFYDRKVHSDNK